MNIWNKYLAWATNRENVNKKTYLIWAGLFGLIAVIWAANAVREYSICGLDRYVICGIIIVLLNVFISAARLCQYFNYEKLKRSEDSLGGNNYE